MGRVSIDFLESNVAGVPRAGMVVRAIPSSKSREWGLLRLDSIFEYRGKPHEWLLIRYRDEEIDRDASHSNRAEVLLVGALPHVGDGFDEGAFEHMGDAVVETSHLNLSRRQRFWLRFALVAAILAGAGWYMFNFDPESWSGRLVGRLLFLVPELIR